MNTLSGTGAIVLPPVAPRHRILEIVNQSGPGTFSGVISGGGTLALGGQGVLTLSGINTYTGPTVISHGGTLALSGSGSIVDSSTLIIIEGATFDLSLTTSNTLVNTLQGGVESAILLSTLLPITPNLIVFQTIPGTFAGVILGNGGNGGLIIDASSTSTLTLSGINSYTGSTFISAGTLALSGSGSIAQSSELTLSGAGATLDLSLTTGDTYVNTLQGFAGSSILLSPLLNPQNFPLNLVVTQASLVPFAGFAGVIEANGGNGGLTVLGTNTLTLSGVNTYTGPTTVGGIATLALSGGGSIASSSSLTVNGGATFDVSQSTSSPTVNNLSGAGNIALPTGPLLPLAVDQTSPGTFSGVISGINELLVNGSSTLTLSGVNTYTGLTVVNSPATLALVGNGSIANSFGLLLEAGATFDLSDTTSGATLNGLSGAGTVNAGGQPLTVNVNPPWTFSGMIEGSGVLTINGSGNLTLSGVNSYIGPTIVSGSATLALSGERLDRFLFLADR